MVKCEICLEGETQEHFEDGIFFLVCNVCCSEYATYDQINLNKFLYEVQSNLPKSSIQF